MAKDSKGHGSNGKGGGQGMTDQQREAAYYKLRGAGRAANMAAAMKPRGASGASSKLGGAKKRK